MNQTVSCGFNGMFKKIAHLLGVEIQHPLQQQHGRLDSVATMKKSHGVGFRAQEMRDVSVRRARCLSQTSYMTKIYMECDSLFMGSITNLT